MPKTPAAWWGGKGFVHPAVDAPEPNAHTIAAQLRERGP